MMPLQSPPPLSLYIHMPWCVRKCPYCDFNSHHLKNELPEKAYLEKLLQDLKLDLPKVWGRTVSSIFIGGGTPSLFSPESYHYLLSEIRGLLPLAPGCEITMEANPGTMEQNNFAGYRAAGINRLSIGIQSFNDEKLKRLGRIHGANEALKAIDTAKQAGFDNFNLDLMFALPSQTVEQALQDLTTAMQCQPTHLSWYQLTLEPNTLFAHNPPALPDHDLIWQIQQQGQQLLAQHGFKQYEVSAYCQQENYCQHNVNYWTFGDYLAIGAGAHGKITDINEQTISRYWKIKHPKAYLSAENNFTAEWKVIPQNEIAFEFMLNALRLQQKISKQLFEQRTGIRFKQIEPILFTGQQKGLITLASDHFELTEQGHNFLNDVVALFL